MAQTQLEPIEGTDTAARNTAGQFGDRQSSVEVSGLDKDLVNIMSPGLGN